MANCHYAPFALVTNDQRECALVESTSAPTLKLSSLSPFKRDHYSVTFISSSVLRY